MNIVVDYGFNEQEAQIDLNKETLTVSPDLENVATALLRKHPSFFDAEIECHKKLKEFCGIMNCQPPEAVSPRFDMSKDPDITLDDINGYTKWLDGFFGTFLPRRTR